MPTFLASNAGFDVFFFLPAEAYLTTENTDAALYFTLPNLQFPLAFQALLSTRHTPSLNAMQYLA